LQQVAIARGNDPHVGAAGLVFVDPLELASLQDTQQLGLLLQRHVANLVEKQKGASVGELKAADPVAHRSGENASHVFKNPVSNRSRGMAVRVRRERPSALPPPLNMCLKLGGRSQPSALA
jgi:hypothetical protein